MTRLSSISHSSRWIIGAVFFLIIALFALSWYWSLEPAPIEQPKDSSAASSRRVAGVTTVNVLIESIQTLLDKPGGYLSNDITPPGILMDNMPAWEYGALVQLRDFTKLLRNQFSRGQAQTQPDPDLAKADPKLNVDNSSWIFPSSEGAYSESIEYLKEYRARLLEKKSPEAHFFARADNLRLWLKTVSRRIGGFSKDLQLAGGKMITDNAAKNIWEASSDTSPGNTGAPKVSWWQVDNVFYRARGASWALLNIARALEVDFHAVLKDKNALSTFVDLEQTLEAAQAPMYSPIVLTGYRFGVFANHALALDAYTATANPTVINLMQTLKD